MENNTFYKQIKGNQIPNNLTINTCDISTLNLKLDGLAIYNMPVSTSLCYEIPKGQSPEQKSEQVVLVNGSDKTLTLINKNDLYYNDESEKNPLVKKGILPEIPQEFDTYVTNDTTTEMEVKKSYDENLWLQGEVGFKKSNSWINYIEKRNPQLYEKISDGANTHYANSSKEKNNQARREYSPSVSIEELFELASLVQEFDLNGRDAKLQELEKTRQTRIAIQNHAKKQKEEAENTLQNTRLSYLQPFNLNAQKETTQPNINEQSKGLRAKIKKIFNTNTTESTKS